MLDDLYAADNAAIAQDLVARPTAAPAPTPKFSLWKAATAAPRGVAAGANESAGFMSDMLGAFGQVAAAGQTGSAGMFSTLNDDDRKASDEARKKILTQGVDMTSEAGQDFRATAKTFMPDPETAHAAENVVFGLGRFATKAVGYSVMGGPLVGAGLTGLDEGMTTASDLKGKGVDLTTRTQVGALAGAAAAAGVVLPVAGKTVAGTAGLVAAGGPGAFIAQQAATRQILQDADYGDIAMQYDPFDPVGLAVATLVPAGFGAFALRGAGRGKAHATTEQVDAARVEMLTQHVENARLTPPEDVYGARAHNEAMSRAMVQIAKGERVDVLDVAPVSREAPTDTPEFRAWFGGSKVVDEQGQPLIVYHGTAADVRAFDQGKLQAEGIHLTTDSSVANRYAASRSMDGGRGANVIPLYVKAERVRDVQMITTEAIKTAAAEGFDAVRRGDHLVVMHPDQVKSAIGNSGKFDPNSPSLTDSRFSTWAEQINAAIAEIRDAAAKTQGQADGTPGKPLAVSDGQGAARGADAGASVADRGRGADGAQGPGVDTAARQPGSPERPSGAGSDGNSGPGSVGEKAEAAAINQRLMAIQEQHPDLHVHIDGMDAPMRLADFLEEVKRQAAAETEDAPLYQVAAECFVTNGP